MSLPVASLLKNRIVTVRPQWVGCCRNLSSTSLFASLLESLGPHIWPIEQVYRGDDLYIQPHQLGFELHSVSASGLVLRDRVCPGVLPCPTADRLRFPVDPQGTRNCCYYFEEALTAHG